MFPFNLSSPISQYNNINNPPRRHENAKFVRTLPLIAGLCSLKNFVEIWTLCANRSDEFYENKLEKRQQNAESSTNKSQRRRDGQLIFKKLPFAVVLYVSHYLKHLPILRLPENMKFSCPGHFYATNAPFVIGAEKFLTIVEDMEFDINRVVSFCVRLAVGGEIVKDSRFFMNPDMTIGIWIPKYDFSPKKLGESDDEPDKNKRKDNDDDDDDETVEKKPQASNINKKKSKRQERKSAFAKLKALPRIEDEEDMMKEILFFDRLDLSQRRDPPNSSTQKNNNSQFLLPTDGSVILMDPRFTEFKGILLSHYWIEGSRR